MYGEVPSLCELHVTQSYWGKQAKDIGIPDLFRNSADILFSCESDTQLEHWKSPEIMYAIVIQVFLSGVLLGLASAEDVDESEKTWTGTAHPWTGETPVWTGTARPYTGPTRPWTGTAHVWTGPTEKWTGTAHPYTGPTRPWTGTAGPEDETTKRPDTKSDSCFSFTCHNTLAGCFMEMANSHCPRKSNFCKVTITKLGNVTEIVAECVEESCEFTEMSSDKLGHMTFSCCQSHLCNNETLLLQSSAVQTAPSFLMTLLSACFVVWTKIAWCVE